MNRKPYWEMTSRELADATAQFDEPFVIDQSRALTRAERKQWDRAKKKKTQAKPANGRKRISVAIDSALLKKATALAKKRRVSRSQLFAHALELALARDE